jgi:ribonuclease R
MLAANEAVAEHIAAAAAPMVYRIHETPDPRKVLDFEDLAAQFGASLGVDAAGHRRFTMTTRNRDGRKTQRQIAVATPDVRITSRHYQKLISKIEGSPLERILSYLMLRSLKQARYSVDNRGHFALASACYCHFTSPIRRYPDLLVHRALTALFDSAPPPHEAELLAAFAEHSSLTERTAGEAERELVEWKKVGFMADRVGDDFAALIISTTKFGFFVELEEFFIEGLVPIDTLPGDSWGYHENSRRIVGRRTRQEFRIGDRVRVRLDRIDSTEMKLQFSVLVPKKSKRNR